MTEYGKIEAKEKLQNTERLRERERTEYGKIEAKEKGQNRER